MAKIIASAPKAFRINRWLGLNEAPDGDTALKLGEAAETRNWRVTNDGTLRRRPGTQKIACLAAAPSPAIGPKALYSTDDATNTQKYTVYPSVSVGSNGLPVVSGDSATVTYDTQETYVGHYMQDEYSRVWQFSECVYDDTTQTYNWYFKPVTVSSTAPVKALWSGTVGASDVLVAASDGNLWKLSSGSPWTLEVIGTVDTSGNVTLFGFDGKLYILAAGQYKVWNGTTLSDVEGYRPLVFVACAPAGGGTALEQINKLNGLRRCWFSPDGTSTVFHLSETSLASIDWVKVNGTTITTGFTASTSAGTVTFDTAPAEGTDNIEIAWTVSATLRSTVTAMKYAELYNGTTDNRVFLYGDGSNEAFYSGLDYDGKPRADYFPDENEIAVGESSTPVTALVRHYSSLIAFKTDSAWSIRYDYITLADGTVTAAFFTIPMNRDIGNAAPGQAQLVLNSPRTLCAGGVYDWKNNSSYTANLTIDERQAKRISERVENTLSGFDLASCICWDDNDAQEYYIVGNSGTLVHNYAVDAWCYYTNFPVTCFARYNGNLFAGTSHCTIVNISDQYTSDIGSPIAAYWESGSMAFTAENMKKTVNEMYITVKPSERGKVEIIGRTDGGQEQDNLVLYSGEGGLEFENLNFSALSFRAEIMPNAHKIRTRLKFVYLKLIFQSNEVGTNASVLSALIPVNYIGPAR